MLAADKWLDLNDTMRSTVIPKQTYNPSPAVLKHLINKQGCGRTGGPALPVQNPEGVPANTYRS